MPLSVFAKNNILNYTFGGTAYTGTLPAKLWFGLSKVAVDDTYTGTTIAAHEPASADGYYRAYHTGGYDNNKTTWSVSATGTLYNKINIAFPASTAAWGTILSIFIVDAATAGNIYAFYTLNPSITVQAGTTLTWAGASGSGSINITLT
jgi:hypothetical protein